MGLTPLTPHPAEANMSKHTYVCFSCRTATRRDFLDSRSPHWRSVRCRRCGEVSTYLGVKIRVLAQRDARAWTALRHSLTADAQRNAATSDRIAIRRRHDIEQEIAKLEQRPSNPGRTALIKQLRKRLGRITPFSLRFDGALLRRIREERNARR